MSAIVRSDFLFKALVAGEMRRFDDMYEHMKGILRLGRGVNLDELELLATAFKTYIHAKRNSWRTLRLMRCDGGGEFRRDSVRSYLVVIGAELRELSMELIGLLDDLVIRRSQSNAVKATAYSLKADCCRYVLEVTAENESRYIEMAWVSYDAAMAKAENLPTPNLTKAGIVLNFCVFYADVINLKRLAVTLAVAVVNSIKACENSRSKKILQSLHNNICRWVLEIQAEDLALEMKRPIGAAVVRKHRPRQ